MKLASVRFLFAVLLFFPLFDSYAFLKEVEPCQIAPNGRQVEVTVDCFPMEKSISVLGSPETPFVGVFHLEFTKNLFNHSRIVHIRSAVGEHEPLAQVQVDENRRDPDQPRRKIQIRFLKPNATWLIDGFQRVKAEIDELSIQSVGTLIIQDKIQVNSKLKVDGERVFFQSPFSVRKGTFDLRYLQGGVERLSYPFHTQMDQGRIRMESVGVAETPSLKRPTLEPFLQDGMEIGVQEFEQVVEQVSQTRLSDRFPEINTRGTEPARNAYVKNTIPQRLSNREKGEIGELIFRRYMAREKKNYRYENSKMGVHSFDGVFNSMRRDPQDGSIQGDLWIVEVKFVTSSSVELGTREVKGIHWRQLSGPYNLSVLEEMSQSSELTTRQLGRRILKLKDRVKLKLAVFDASTFRLNIYDVGTWDDPRLN